MRHDLVLAPEAPDLLAPGCHEFAVTCSCGWSEKTNEHIIRGRDEVGRDGAVMILVDRMYTHLLNSGIDKALVPLPCP